MFIRAASVLLASVVLSTSAFAVDEEVDTIKDDIIDVYEDVDFVIEDHIIFLTVEEGPGSVCGGCVVVDGDGLQAHDLASLLEVPVQRASNLQDSDAVILWLYEDTKNEIIESVQSAGFGVIEDHIILIYEDNVVMGIDDDLLIIEDNLVMIFEDDVMM